MNEYSEFLNQEIQDIWSRIAESTAMPGEMEEDEEDEDATGANV